MFTKTKGNDQNNKYKLLKDDIYNLQFEGISLIRTNRQRAETTHGLWG